MTELADRRSIFRFDLFEWWIRRRCLILVLSVLCMKVQIWVSFTAHYHSKEKVLNFKEIKPFI